MLHINPQVWIKGFHSLVAQLNLVFFHEKKFEHDMRLLRKYSYKKSLLHETSKQISTLTWCSYREVLSNFSTRRTKYFQTRWTVSGLESKAPMPLLDQEARTYLLRRFTQQHTYLEICKSAFSVSCVYKLKLCITSSFIQVFWTDLLKEASFCGEVNVVNP